MTQREVALWFQMQRPAQPDALPGLWLPRAWRPTIPSVWKPVLWFTSGDSETSWGQQGWKARPLDPEKPPGPGCSQSLGPHAEGERAPAEAYRPAVFSCQEGRATQSGKGPCCGVAPTVTASTSVSPGARPGEEPGIHLYTPVPDGSLRSMSPFSVPPSAQLPISIILVSHQPYPRPPAAHPVLSAFLTPFLCFFCIFCLLCCKDTISRAYPFQGSDHVTPPA